MAGILGTFVVLVLLLLLLCTSRHSQGCCQGDSSPPEIYISRTNLTTFLYFSHNSKIRDVFLTFGHNYSIACRKVGLSAVSVIWYNENTAVGTSNSERVYVMQQDSTTMTLKITLFRESDKGLYHCRAGDGSASLMITDGNPVVTIGHEDEYRKVTNYISRPILSAFYDGDPIPKILKWTFNGGNVQLDTLVQANDIILSRTLTRAHTGNYTFMVNNSVGIASGTTRFIVTFKPFVVMVPSEEQLIGKDTMFNITCSDNVGVPRPSFHWIINDVLVNESGNGIVLSDLSNETDQVQQLQITSAYLNQSGFYMCVADNSNRVVSSNSQRVRITVIGPPLPPAGIQSTPTSSCQANINLTVYQSDSNYTFSDSDRYIIQIQYVITDVGSLEWVKLLEGDTTLHSVRILFGGGNTMYMLRGRGLNGTWGEGQNSDVFGPFIAYRNDKIPTPTSVRAYPIDVLSLQVTWNSMDECYQFINFTVVCLKDGASSDNEVHVTPLGVVSMAVVPGLEEDVYYTCHVLGRVVVMGESVGGAVREVQINSSASVRSFTYPKAPLPPEMPIFVKSSTTSYSFTVTLKPLATNFNNISHYQILVLRLKRDTAPPNAHPDTLYPSKAYFSTCNVTNNPNRKEAETYLPYLAAEISAKEFVPGEFIIGGAKEGIGGDNVSCNGKLLPGTSYTIFLRAFSSTLGEREVEVDLLDRVARRRRNALSKKQDVVFASSDFLKPISTLSGGESPNKPITSHVTAIVIVLVLVMAVILVVPLVIGFAYYLKKRNMLAISYSVDRSPSISSSHFSGKNDDTPDLVQCRNGRRQVDIIDLKAPESLEDESEILFEQSGEIRREDFAAHVETFDAKRQLLFQEEFDWITKHSPWYCAAASNHPINDSKNRYSNITAFDHSRVKLSPLPGVECSDYINANFITGNHPKEYIASQGPLEQTVEDFWRMVWEQKTTTIIMLTNVVELGKTKCSQYWPISSTTVYGFIAVTLDATHVFPDYTIRTLSVATLANADDSRRILQFHYTKWPDYGTPKLAAPLLNFLRIVHESNTLEKAGPIIVHCSAGVGRSGTVLTIDHCLQELRNKSVVNICGFVQKMRQQRNYMVQTDQQYTFIHYALLEAITYGDTSYEVNKFMGLYTEMQRQDGGTKDGQFLLEEEFQRLGMMKTMVKKSSFQNRIKVKGAPQRHFHSSFHGGSPSGSIQQCLGHFLDSYNQSSVFVVMEGPDVRTANRFWEMVWDQGCEHIIMLTPLDSEELFQYWPLQGEELLFGAIKVVVESESAEHLYTCRNIQLSNTKVEGISHQVVQYQFMGWTLQYLPRVPDFVSFFCAILKVKTIMEINSKVLIHDTASLGPVGIFCSLFYCIQRLQMEKLIDIFQAVQFVQLQRPGCVSTLGDYAFIYDSVHEFLMKNS